MPENSAPIAKRLPGSDRSIQAGKSLILPFKIFTTTLLRWQQRAIERTQLRELERHILDDIGMTRSECAKEARKPFWKP